MPTTTTNLFSHETVNRLVVEPLLAESVALSTLRVIRTQSTIYYLPTVGNGTAAWVDELQTIPDAGVDASMAEVRPRKVAATATVSNESVSDANAAAMIGGAIVSGLAQEADRAFFAGAAPTGPAGIPAIIGTQAITGDPAAGLDPYVDGISAIESVGGQAGAIYVAPATWASLSKLKATTGSNQPVLSPEGGISEAQARSLFGVPVYTNQYVAAGEAWIVDVTRTVAVIRLPFTVENDSSVLFASDGTMVRAVGRVEYASAYPETIAHISSGV